MQADLLTCNADLCMDLYIHVYSCNKLSFFAKEQHNNILKNNPFDSLMVSDIIFDITFVWLVLAIWHACNFKKYGDS